MAEVLPPKTNFDFKVKCGDVYLEKQNLTIICVFCGLSAPSYEEFVVHLRYQHWRDFLPEGESEEEAENAHHCRLDPLDSERTAEVLSEPLNFEVEQLKSEAPEDMLNESLMSSESEPPSGGDEIMTCDIKEEQLDQSVINSMKSPMKAEELSLKASRRDSGGILERVISKEIPSSIAHEANATQETTNACRTSDEDSNSHSSASPGLLHVQKERPDMDTQSTTSNQSNASATDVDWTQPYAPEKLKIHDKRRYKPRKKPIVCTYCGKTFQRRHQLDNHTNLHTGQKPHQCEICGKLFRAGTTLARHLNTHKPREDFCCKYCAKTFTHKAALLSHESRYTQERSFPCVECEKSFFTQNHLDTHKRMVHKKRDDDTEALPYACDLCEKRYRSASMLSTHKLKKHYRTAKFPCDQCEKKFTNDEQLAVHKNTHVIQVKGASRGQNS